MTALIRRLLLAPLLCATLALPLAAHADVTAPASASSADTPTTAQSLVLLREQLDDLRTKVDSGARDLSLSDLKSSAQQIEQQAAQIATTLGPQLAALQTRIDVLGPAPVKGSSEPAELASQRRRLDRDHRVLDAQIKQANSLDTEAGQLATHMAQMRRDEFQAQLAERSATPFSESFWLASVHALPDDLARLDQLGGKLRAAFANAWQPANRWPFLACLITALLLVSVGRWLIEQTVLRVTSHRMPGGRLRRSVLAAASVLAWTLTIGIAAKLLHLALNWNGDLDDQLEQMLHRWVGLVFFCAYLVGLGRALIAARRPSWRLPELSNRVALALRPFPWWLGLTTLLLGTAQTVSDGIDASLPITLASHALLALLVGFLLGLLLVRLGRARRARLQQDPDDTDAGKRPLWIATVVAITFVCVLLMLGGVITGYIAFAFFIALQTLWVGVILMSLYLAVKLLDDAIDTVCSPKGKTAMRMEASFGIDAGKLDQLGTVLSGVSRAVLVILAATVIGSPFGASPQDLLGSIGTMLSGAGALKKFSIVPGDILMGLLVGVVGFLVVRLVKRWLSESLLPKTSLDLGMRASVTTLFGYVGGALVVVVVLLRMQINLQAIAWIASALSVGIGFGLQAIVQNFVSGLIVLTERPVKVGDWVSIGDVEGDVKRVSVRATEIQLYDRSTMIVPNSQFITSNVRNVTRANAQGRVQIKLPMPLDTDADKARQLMLEAFHNHATVLEKPAPNVQLTNVDASAMYFVATGYVRNPRDASGVKSDLLFEIVRTLREAELPMSSPQNMVVRTLGPPSPLSPGSGAAPAPTPAN